jgi:CBS-domain-containing membrane protein
VSTRPPLTDPARAALRRQQLPLVHQHGPALGIASAVVCAVVVAVAGLDGHATDLPFLFPSVGPTLMVLSETPDKPSARPRNVLVGHAVGIAAGWLALAVTGLLDHPPSLQEGITLPRIVAAAVALGLTALALQVLRAPHPPAGATTLIVALGLLHTGRQLITMMTAVVLCTALTLAVREVFHRSMRSDPATEAD